MFEASAYAAGVFFYFFFRYGILWKLPRLKHRTLVAELPLSLLVDRVPVNPPSLGKEQEFPGANRRDASKELV